MLVSVSLSNSTFIENMWSTLCIHLNLIQCSMLKRTYCVCVCEWVRIFGKWLENLPKPNISINFNYSIKHPSMGRFMFTYLHRNGELVEKVDIGQCSNDAGSCFELYQPICIYWICESFHKFGKISLFYFIQFLDMSIRPSVSTKTTTNCHVNDSSQ